VGKANGSRECAPDDRLRVPTIDANEFGEMVGTLRFAHPTNHPTKMSAANYAGA
jgi:hypothetical protein